jgi:hypothetical protein
MEYRPGRRSCASMSRCRNVSVSRFLDALVVMLILRQFSVGIGTKEEKVTSFDEPWPVALTQRHTNTVLSAVSPVDRVSWAGRVLSRFSLLGGRVQQGRVAQGRDSSTGNGWRGLEGWERGRGGRGKGHLALTRCAHGLAAKKDERRESDRRAAYMRKRAKTGAAARRAKRNTEIEQPMQREAQTVTRGQASEKENSTIFK